MIYITDETRQLIDNAYAEGVPCILGTASADGHPQISMKGSVLVFDRETLAYWERAKRSVLENVGENPNVVVFYRNPEQRINWRFYGTATVYRKRRNLGQCDAPHHTGGTRPRPGSPRGGGAGQIEPGN